MDNNSKQLLARKRIHSGLPRQGPGSDVTTANALRRLPQIPSPARIYDLGCGPGRAAIMLANILQQHIVAVDLQEDFLNELHHSATQKGISHLIETRCADMASLDDDDGSVDLIWSEGAIYCVGFDAALTSWRPSLSDKGLVACSELSWLTASPSSEPAAFWRENYPGMRSVTENLLAVEQLGYACLDHFTLPEHCWWDEFYGPWLRHLEMLKDEAEHDDFLRTAIAKATTEIKLFRQFNSEYGYEFYLLQKSNVIIQ